MALEDFVARYRSTRPSLFEIVIYSACEARLTSLRCDDLGPMAFRFVTHGSEGLESFRRLLTERIPVSTFVQVDVERPQLAPTSPDR